LYVAPDLALLGKLLVHATWFVNPEFLIDTIELAKQLYDLPVGVSVVS
jgi:hypothetical protein